MVEWFNALKDGRKLVVFRFVVGIFFTALFSFGFSIYKSVNHTKEIKTYQDKVDNLAVEIKTLTGEISKLKVDLVKCQNNYNLIRSGLDDLPIPAYIIDAYTYRASYVNPAYEDFYLKPLGFTKFDILGTTGSHIFGEKAIKAFHETNEKLKQRKTPVSEWEPVYRDPREKRENTKFLIYQMGQLTHIGGISYEYFKN